MILAACGGRGNGEKYAEGLARAKSGGGEWAVGGGEGGTGRRGMGRGGWQRGGGDGEGSNRDGKRVAMPYGEGDNVRKRWRGGQ